MEYYENDLVLSNTFDEEGKEIINSIFKIRLTLALVDYKLKETNDNDEIRKLLRLSYQLNKERIRLSDKIYSKNSAA